MYFFRRYPACGGIKKPSPCKGKVLARTWMRQKRQRQPAQAAKSLRPPQGKPPFERRCPSSQTGAEDCILAKPKCAKQTQGLQTWVYCVCFASQNAILSQPSADSPFQKGPCRLRAGRGLWRIRPPGQVVDGDAVKIGHTHQDGQLWLPLSGLIVSVCAGTDLEFLGTRFLRQTVFLP